MTPRRCPVCGRSDTNWEGPDSVPDLSDQKSMGEGPHLCNHEFDEVDVESRTIYTYDRCLKCGKLMTEVMAEEKR